MHNRAEKVKRIITRRIQLMLAQSVYEDTYRETAALRDAISFALQGTSDARFGINFLEEHVPRGKKLTKEGIQAVERLEDLIIEGKSVRGGLLEDALGI
jgi:hypothetical protein